MQSGRRVLLLAGSLPDEAGTLGFLPAKSFLEVWGDSSVTFRPTS
ncbi:hypothetical protein EMIT0P258_20022 [Pseudomonas sp. IT-P258]